MGIERFFSTLNSLTDIWLTEKFPLDINSRKKVNYLLMDFNSIIHTQSAKLLSRVKNDNITLESFEKSLIKNIEEYLLDLFQNYLNPSELEFLMIAIDGVPSLGKIKEQQKRRYLSELFNLHLNKFKENKTEFEWSKNNISPYTRFMNKLNLFLNSKEFTKKLQDKIPSLKEILISDSREEGEGEMKILQVLRNKKFKKNSHLVIFSPDSDMVLLNLLVKPEYQVYLLRYDQEKSKNENKIDFYNWLEMKDLRKYLLNYSEEILETKLNEVNLISDIIFLFNFFGNDFLPKITSFNAKIDFFILIDYYLIHKSKNDYLTKKNTINWESLKNLLMTLSKIEPKLKILRQKAENYTNFDTVIFNNFHFHLLDLKSNIENQNQKQNLRKFLNQDYFGEVMLRVIDKIELYQYVKSKNLFSALLNKYKSLFIYFVSIEELFDLVINFYQENRNKNFPLFSTRSFLKKDFERKLSFREKSYSSKSKVHQERLNKMSSLYEKEKYLMENFLDEYYQFLNPKVDDNLKINKKNQVEEYLIGVDWVYQYYFYNKINPGFFYSYSSAPEITELSQNFIIPKIINIPFKINLLQHSLLITPIRYSNLISSLETLKDLESQDTLNKIINFIEKTKIIPDLDKIYQEIFIEKKKLIDCSSTIFLSKCHLELNLNEFNFIKRFKV
jgi:5'-3' exonuclease